MSHVQTGVLISNRQAMTRRQLLRTLGVASVGVPLVQAFTAREVSAQGRCMLTMGSPACNTTAIKPVFEPTGWKTVALEQITFQSLTTRRKRRSTQPSWDGRCGTMTASGP